MDNVIVPQEWPRRKKIRSICILLFIVVATLIISVN
jgi:hypothetical protein